MKKTLVKLTAFILATCMCIGMIPTMADEANPESNPDEMLMLSEDVVELEEESATAAVLEEIVTEELVQDPSEEVASTEELEITEPVIEETVPEVVEPVEETAPVAEEVVEEPSVEEPTPIIEEQVEVAVEEPSVEEPTPIIEEQVEVAVEEPSVEEPTPIIEEQVEVVVEEPSVIAEAPAEEPVAEETVIIEETQTLAPETEAVVQEETAVIESATETTVEEVTTEKATEEETTEKETEQDDDLELMDVVGSGEYFSADTVGDGYITVNPGEPVTMAVTVDASDTYIQYEWYVKGLDNEWQLIEGINGNTYTISNTIKVAGEYLCEVSDSHGNSQKLIFNVEVENHFSIEENAPIYALAETNVTMSVGVRGDNLADMTYQWIVPGADEEEFIIEGANTAVYESAPIKNQWATCYACKVQDCYGNRRYAYFDIILINDLQELSLDEVVSVTQTIPYSIIAYKYVPALTGNYQIQLFESNIYCTICDENWNDLASNYQELSYDLQAGKTYYFKVQISDEATGIVEAKLTMPEEHHMTSEVVSEATCIAEGEIKYTCKDDGCDYTYTDTIPVLPHELVKTEQKEATAEENGNIEYWTCCNCHKYFSDAEGKTEISLEDTITTVAAEPIEISSATVSGISNKTYNGNAQTQTIVGQLSRQKKRRF